MPISKVMLADVYLLMQIRELLLRCNGQHLKHELMGVLTTCDHYACNLVWYDTLPLMHVRTRRAGRMLPPNKVTNPWQAVLHA